MASYKSSRIWDSKMDHLSDVFERFFGIFFDTLRNVRQVVHFRELQNETREMDHLSSVLMIYYLTSSETLDRWSILLVTK